MQVECEELLIASYAQVVQRDLRRDAGGELYVAPAVIVMHGTQDDPIFCYANRTAQQLWGYSWAEFIQLPSRLSAQREAQAERGRLLAEARAKGFIANYSGVRIARDGRRFQIANVTLWNVTVTSERHGQAAIFRDWTWLAEK